MEDFKIKEIDNLLLIMHGHFATITYNEVNEIFHKKLSESDVTLDAYNESYDVLSSFVSDGYYDNKDEIDNEYVDEVIGCMRKIIKYAEIVKGYEEMGEINKSLSDDAMASEGSEKFNDGGKYNG